MAHDDVLATRAKCVAGADKDHVARMADYFQTAHHAPAEQIAIVELTLFDYIVVEPVEILIGQELAGKEARPAEAFEPAAFWARLHRPVTRRLVRAARCCSCSCGHNR
jgi:hypothetical protein